MNAQLEFRLLQPRAPKVSAFYVTTPLSPRERAEAIARADAQDERVLAVYRCAGRPLTPSEAHLQLQACGRNEPITSIRRAINTLTKAGALVKLSTTERGPWGSLEHHWDLPRTSAAA